MTPTVMLVAGDPEQYTGGYIYDARIARAATQAGHPLETVGLAGDFPDADSEAESALGAACSPPVRTTNRSSSTGWFSARLPDIIAREAGRLRLVALVHHPLADESGIDGALADRLFANERRALAQAAHVIVTSAFTARRLVSAYGVALADLDIVEPGLDKPATSRAADTAVGTPHLLCVASLIPRKGHAVLVEALARIADLDWRCDCIGDTERDPAVHARTSATPSIVISSPGASISTGSRPPETLSAAYRQRVSVRAALLL